MSRIIDTELAELIKDIRKHVTALELGDIDASTKGAITRLKRARYETEKALGYLIQE